MSTVTKLNPRTFTAAIAICAAGLFSLGSASAKGAQGTAPSSIRGETILAGKGNCLTCHRVADRGSYMAPDLSAIGSNRKPEEIRKALLSPNAEVAPANRLYRAVTNQGKEITGRLLNQDIYIVQMLTSDSQLVTLKRSDLRSLNAADTPPMPSYREKLTAAELDDLVSYLASLQGVIKQ